MARLREFGISDYAGRAYVALLDLGVAEARDVAAMGKVPAKKIYQVLEQLHERGLVEILPENPRRFRPRPFEDYVTKIQREHEAAIRALEGRRDEFAEWFRVLGEAGAGTRGGFTVVRGRRNSVEKVKELISGAATEYLALGTRGSVNRTGVYLDELQKARARGVRIQALVPVTDATLPLLAPLAEVAEVRHRALAQATAGENVSIVIADRKRAFIVETFPNDASAVSGNDVGIYTDSEAIVSALAALVDDAWARAPPLVVPRPPDAQ